MNKSYFPYDQWVMKAMRNVLACALNELCNSKDTGDHHLYINFWTQHNDVIIPVFLKNQYPESMTIVLQHHYENLVVKGDGFEVSLSFSGEKYQLFIPFDAVISFSDPSVNFEVNIGMIAVDKNAIDTSVAGNPGDSTANLAPPNESIIGKNAEDSKTNIPSPSGPRDKPTEDSKNGGKGDQIMGEVINLEKFRKK